MENEEILGILYIKLYHNKEIIVKYLKSSKQFSVLVRGQTPIK